MKFFVLQTYLGDELIQELFMPDTDHTHQYIEVVTNDTKNHFHPETRNEILTLELIDTKIVRPDNPRSLSEVIG